MPLDLTDYHPTPDVARASTLPARWYLDPAMLAAEQRRVFARTWQWAGASARLPTLATTSPAKWPAIRCSLCAGRRRAARVLERLPASRGADRRRLRQRAGAPVPVPRLDLPARRQPAQRARDGRRRVLPPEEVRLREARIEELGRWRSSTSIAARRRSPSSWPRSRPRSRRPASASPSWCPSSAATTRSTSNWKVYVDNYLEGYHVPIAHPGLYRAIDYDRYEVVPRRFHSAQYAPLRSGDATRRMLGRDRRYLRSDDEERALYYWIFPNLMLNLYADNLQLNAIVPLGLDRTLTIFEWFVHPDLSAEKLERAARVDRLQRRDPARGHRGLRGGAAGPALARLRRRTLLGEARERRAPLPPAAARIPVASHRVGFATRRRMTTPAASSAPEPLAARRRRHPPARLRLWQRQGRPLVLVHGIEDFALALEPLAEAFRGNYHVVSFDLRGHGDSDKPGAYTMGHFIADLHAVIWQLQLERPILVGHSLGGQIVSQYAGVFPEVPRAVVNIDGMGPPMRIPDPDSEEKQLRTREAVEGLLRQGGHGRPMMDLDDATNLYLRFHPRLDPALLASWSSSAPRPIRTGACSTSGIPRSTRCACRRPRRSRRSVSVGRNARFSGFGRGGRRVHVAPARARSVDPAQRPRGDPAAHGSVQGRLPRRIPGAGHHIHFDAPAELVRVLQDFLRG